MEGTGGGVGGDSAFGPNVCLSILSRSSLNFAINCSTSALPPSPAAVYCASPSCAAAERVNGFGGGGGAGVSTSIAGSGAPIGDEEKIIGGGGIPDMEILGKDSMSLEDAGVPNDSFSNADVVWS